MDQSRLLSILRVIAKESIKKQIDVNCDMSRKIKSAVKDFNERYKIDPPLRDSELAEIYVTLGKEIATEHFSVIEVKLMPQSA